MERGLAEPKKAAKVGFWVAMARTEPLSYPDFQQEMGGSADEPSLVDVRRHER